MNLLENMRELGYSEEDLRKVEANPELENFAKIIDAANSFEEAAANLKKAYPNLDVAEFKKLCESEESMPAKEADTDSEEMTDLEDDALEAVAGGSIGSWFKKNWKAVAGFVVAGPAGAVVGGIMGMSQKQQTATGASSRQVAEEARGEKTENGLILG